MAIVGFNFTKMNAERKGAISGNINIKNNVLVKDVIEQNFAFGASKQEGAKFIFEFTSKYGVKKEDDIATITLEGEILFVDDPKRVKELIKTWKKDKKIEQEIMAQVLNAALVRCNILAINLSQDIAVPPPVPMPKVEVSQSKQEKGKEYIG